MIKPGDAALVTGFSKVSSAIMLALGLLSIAPVSAVAAQQENTNSQGEEEVEVITVVGKIESGQYRNDFADSATKTLTANLDIPQPVDVINQQLIQGQFALDMQQIYRNSASVNAVDPLGHTNIRGFRLNENSGGILKNGLRDVSQGFAFQPLANIEKIEIIKGISSALYGRGEPGGLINLITKKPKQDAFLNTSLVYGSDDFYQFNVDANGTPLMDGKLTYRLNMQLNDEESFRDEVERERIFIAPVVSYRISDMQKITIEAEYNDFDQTRDFGVARINGELDALPKERFISADTKVDTEIKTFQITHEWFVTPDWFLNTKFRFGRDETDDALFNPLTEGLQTALNNPALWMDQNPRVYRTYTTADDEKDELNLDINLAGDIELAGMDHSLLFGINYNERDTERTSHVFLNQALYMGLGTVDTALSPYAMVSQVDPFNPTDHKAINLPTALALGTPLGARHEMTDSVILSDGDTNIESLGLYFQDQIRFNDQWQLVVGARYDDFDYEQNQHTLNTNFAFGGFLYAPNGQVNPMAYVDTLQDESDDEITSRAGLIYTPTDNMAFYASWGQQFDIQLGVDAQGRPFDPLKSKAKEVGAKWDVTSDLTVNLAWFDIQKTNLLTLDAENPLFSRQQGEVTSKGWEVSALGRLTPHWVISANYSDFNAEVTEDPTRPQNIGKTERGTPEQSGGLWLQWEMNEYGQDGLTIAIGANHVGARPGDDANSYELPAYTLLDTTISYRFNETVKLKLQIDNLTDKRWYQGAFHSYSIFPGYGTVGKLSVDISL